jgi:hypothetical protein
VGPKDLILRPIDSATARAAIRRWHYSGKVTQNSQLHIGVFWQGALEGALQFGPPLDRRKVLVLVHGSKWADCLELNRLAFSDRLPRNSESRALAVACRLLRRHAPQVKWLLTFADATACGDGTIYRAAGFILTSIKRNSTIWQFPDGSRVAGVALRTNLGYLGSNGGASSMTRARAAGGVEAPGFQLRYVKFLDPAWRARLAVPELPYAAIAAAGATMYRGRSAGSGTAGPPAGGGANPTRPLQPSERV